MNFYSENIRGNVLYNGNIKPMNNRYIVYPAQNFAVETVRSLLDISNYNLLRSRKHFNITS